MNENDSIFDDEEENVNRQDKLDSEETSGKSEVMSRDEVPDELEKEEDEDFNLDGTPRNHDTGVVTSLTQGTNKYYQPTRRTYDDLLAILKEKEKAIKKLSYQINGDEFNAVEFSYSQEKLLLRQLRNLYFHVNIIFIKPRCVE